LVSGDVE